MKSFVFVRGIDRPEKHLFVDILLKEFNPDASHVSAALFVLPRSDSTEQMKIAGRTMKNHVRRMIVNGYDPYIIINAECLTPQHWQSYPGMAEEIEQLGDLVGIDVIFDKTILTGDEVGRKNLQERNSASFIADMTKYYSYTHLIDDPQAVAKSICGDLKGEQT